MTPLLIYYAQRPEWLGADRTDLEVTSDFAAFASATDRLRVDIDFDTHGRRVEEGQLPVLAQAIFSVRTSLPASYVRVNLWPGFAPKGTVEVVADEAEQPMVSQALLSLGFSPLWVPDVEGLVAPRLVAGICQEASLALNDGLASKQHIDLAMKLGTNYPLGPFEWMEKLGTERSQQLLAFAAKMVAHD